MVLAIVYGVALLAFGAWTLVWIWTLAGHVADLENEVRALKNRRGTAVEESRHPATGRYEAHFEVPRYRGDGYWGEG